MNLISIIPRECLYKIPLNETRRDPIPQDPNSWVSENIEPVARATDLSFKHQGIFEAYRYSLKNTEYASIKILPYKDNAKSLTEKDIDYSASIQPLVYEFDNGPLDEQKQFFTDISRTIQTPAYAVYSGNKSYHYWIWFKHFANNKKQYIKAWTEFFNYLKSLELIPDGLEPDPAMSEPTQYSRTPEANNDGYLKKGKPGRNRYQETIDFNGIEYIQDLTNYIPDIMNISQVKIKDQSQTDPDSPGIILKRLIEYETGLHFKKNRLDPCPICKHYDCFKYDPKRESWKCFSTNHGGINSGFEIEFIQALHGIDRTDAIIYLKRNYTLPDRQYFARDRAIYKQLEQKLKKVWTVINYNFYDPVKGLFKIDIKKVSFELEIHPDTVKYRLKKLENLGFLIQIDKDNCIYAIGTKNTPKDIREGTLKGISEPVSN
jgi:hypothetical protein